MIQFDFGTSGLTNVVAVRYNAAGSVWNTDSEAFEAFNPANVADYAIATAEVADTGVYEFADVAEVNGRAVMCLQAGVSLTEADIVAKLATLSLQYTTSAILADTSHGGSAAVLQLERVIVAATGNNSGVTITGSGSGHGMSIAGGSTGDGLRAYGGSIAGDGFHIMALASGHGLHIQAAGAHDGLRCEGAGGLSGIAAYGQGPGPGLYAQGGSANGAGATFVGNGSNSSGAIFTRGGTGGDDILLSNGDMTIATVTGAVGSVAGNVGGNVAGSVGSVTGAVGSVTGNIGGDVSGKVLGGGAGTITGVGVRAVDDAGNAIASASELAKVPKSDGSVTWNNTALASINAEADSALADAGVTTTRTGYLDNLNVGGLVASQADIQAITVASRVRLTIPPFLERPDAGSLAYRVWLYHYNAVGQAEDLDSVPTFTAENNTGTDRSANLGSPVKLNDTTGIYYVDYTVANDAAIEGIVIKADVTEDAVETRYAIATIVVDTTAVDFTAADRVKLDAIHGKLPSREFIAGSTASTGAIVTADIGLNAANLDAQLGDIPNNAEFEARTLPSGDYFNPAEDTVANVTNVGTTANLTNLPPIPNNWLTAAGISDGAFTAAKFAAGAFDAVWTVGTRTLTSFGTLVSDVAAAVWSAGSRTLTAFGFTVTPSNAADTSAIKAKTDQLTFTDGRVDANAEAVITDAKANKIADHVLRRNQTAVEASSDGDTLDVGSLYGFIQTAQKSNTTDNSGKLTVYQTDGTTELAQIDLTTSPTAEPVTGVSK